LALELRSEASSDLAFARTVHRFVREHVAFVREHGEVFAGPSYTLIAAGGDCDDHVRLTYAILAAGGLPVRLAFLFKPGDMGGPTHVVAQVNVGGRWQWVETTVPSAFGEHPLAAAQRLGIISARGDLATEVRTMSESDLPPVPPGFDERNPPALLEQDAKGLGALGYFAGAPPILIADNPYFRRAVAQFQADWGLTVDGLIGPVTRGKLREALERSGNLGALGVLVPSASKDLSDAFIVGVAQMARDFRALGAKVSGEDFLAVWMSESGCNPHCQGQGCKGPTAPFADFGGLNMMNTQSREGVGFPGTVADWVALEAEEQLPFVRKFYERDVAAFCGGNFGCLRDLGSLYLMNFTPAFMAHAGDPSFVIAGKDGPNAVIFRDNAGISRDGATITVGDMAPFAMRGAHGARWAELQARIRAVGEPPITPAPAPGGTGTLVAGAIALAALAAIWHYYA
jgi:hypothetical protein